MLCPHRGLLQIRGAIMEVVLALAVGVLAFVFTVGYLLVKNERLRLIQERNELEAALNAYIEAHNRSPWPADVESMMGEWVAPENPSPR